MQRKRRNINFGIFSKSPGNYQKKFNSSITNTTLHSIPTVRMSERSNKKSDVCIKSCLICGKEDIYQPTSVVWWRSPHCRSGERRNRTRASQVVMTPLSRLGRYLKIPAYIMCILLLSFVASGMMNSFECYAAVNPTASLSVSNPALSATVAPGDTAYLSSNVTYSASDIDSYTLQVSYANGYSSLKLDGGTTTLSGAGGKTGSSLTNNSWGFAWTNNTTNNTSTNAGLTYYTVPTYGTNGSNLSMGRLEAASNLTSAGNTTLSSTTKRIVFAAKFAENNTNSGHYKTGVQISLAISPKLIMGTEWVMSDGTATGIGSGIVNMQEMSSDVCNQVVTPTAIAETSKTIAPTLKLIDLRDNNEYTIAKLPDGRCWMVDNLRLQGETNQYASPQNTNGKTLTSDDSDLSNKTTYTLPTTLSSISKGDGSFSGNYCDSQSYINSTGSWYNWTAATAGTGGSTESTSLNAGENAPSSICPKGWTLPIGGNDATVNEFGILISSTSANSSTSGVDIVRNAPYHFASTGRVSNGTVYDSGYGFWWSKTAYSNARSYNLTITNNSFSFSDGYYAYSIPKCTGFAVRCIARN